MYKRILLTVLLLCSMILISSAQDRLTNLPTIYITTDSGEDPHSKSFYLPGYIVVKSADPTEELEMVTEIRCRGNSTLNSPKKPYRIKLDKKRQLLNNRSNAKSWVLLANDLEDTLIRNAVAFNISELLEMPFTPSVRFVDLYMNGRCMGNYMLTDQIEVREHRVPVEEQTPETIEANITGGYLIEIDGFSYDEPINYSTSQGIPVTVKYPDDTEINDDQIHYIKNFTNRFESLLFSTDFADSESGYRSMVDEHSLINWYIACELTGNPDAFWSTYLYKYRDVDRFYFGPLWDFDKAFNNDSRLGDATRKLMRIHAHSYKQWIQRIWQDAWFKQAVKDRWQELLDQDILEKIQYYIDNVAAEIDESQQQNKELWGKYVDWYSKVAELKTYINARVEFLTEEFLAEEKPIIPFDSEGYYCTMQNRNTQLLIDLSSYNTQEGNLHMWTRKEITDEEYNSQLWKFVPAGDSYYQIINKHSESAIKCSGKISNLQQTIPDIDNDHQLWKIIETDHSEVYAIINKASGFAIDNSGGGTSNGNPVIGWTNESQTNQNQQWIIDKVEEIEPLVNMDYLPDSDKLYIYPNPTTDRLRIALPNFDSNRVSLSIYSIDGKCIINKSIHINNNYVEISTQDYGLCSGVYLIRLRVEEDIYSSKFIVQ
ncbi:CotH kinase family protein [Bacteroidales bacterium OttesenSCG-928-M11]|nr:CotH kinase family protein [Bacteroidales bacterium OttesenSCG-928-M11]